MSLVLIGHASITPRFPLDQIHDWFPNLAKFGVMLFFALSGYLQTILLLEDEKRFGKILAARFYINRILRIAPTLLVYLVFIWCWAVLTKYETSMLTTVSVLLNFRHVVGGDPLLVHFWSLSIELLFYIIWPLFLAAVQQRRRLLAVTVTACMMPLSSVLISSVVADTPDFYPSQYLRMENILLGCCIALVAPTTRGFLFIQRRPDICLLLSFLIAGVAGFFWMGNLPTSWAWRLGYLTQILSAGIITYAALHLGRSLLSRLLNSLIARRLAQISFGIYVWQQFFMFANPIDWVYAFPPKGILYNLSWFPMNLVLATGVGAASYYLIERPLHPWRKRLANKTTETSIKGFTKNLQGTTSDRADVS